MSVRDNVIELRKIRHADTLVERIIHGAAAEIERLREEAERFRVERDKARRMACEKEETLGCDERGVPRNGSARDHAKRRGWDCFKENTND